jgi:hypothetical protein
VAGHAGRVCYEPVAERIFMLRRYFVGGVAVVSLASAGSVFASGGGTVTWPTTLAPVTFVNQMLTDAGPAVVAGSAVIIGLTILMYIKKGFARKAGQTAGR